MARKKKRKIAEKDLEGFKYLELLEPFLERLCGVGTERDVAGNRDLYFDQYGPKLARLSPAANCGLKTFTNDGLGVLGQVFDAPKQLTC